MKRVFLMFSVFMCSHILVGQSNYFAGKARTHQVKITVPATMTLFSQENSFYPCVSTPEDNPVPDYSAVLTQCVPDKGNKGLNTVLGMVSAILTDKQGRYVAFVNFRGGGEKYEGNNSKVKYLNEHLAYSTIRHDLRYGRYANPSDSDMDEMTEMMTVYAPERAKELFNASAMVSYPMSLYDNAYLNKFTRCKGLVIGRQTAAGYAQTIHLYVLMTDDSAKHFDSYITDLSKCIRFE